MKRLKFLLLFMLIPSLCFGAVDLNGDADYILASDGASFDLIDDFSFSVWVNFGATVPSSGESYILSKTDFGEGKRVYHMTWEGGNGRWAMATGDVSGTSTGTYYVFSDTPATNTWHNLVYTYDTNRGNNNRWKFFINGVEKTLSSLSEPVSAIVNEDTPFMIGTSRSGGSFANQFAGKINEIYVFSKVISLTEKDTLAFSKVKRVGLQISSLNAYFPLDDFADGTVLNTDVGGYKDLSGNGNNGQGTDADNDSFNIAETVLTYP